ncbi:GTP cyclohydrolase 1 (GTP cyclohydrolase I) (GTP-CH-I) [Burkholderia pseudomallei Pakistan 9]|nr:GTP cyclohydrolase 1 (GTP cyclohydrolase I) (GTP-CH-I) [Burkholderia pseudomallei Pakistan 9]
MAQASYRRDRHGRVEEIAGVSKGTQMHQTGNESARDPHDQPPAEIRRVRRFDPIAFEAAVRALLEASGIEIDSAHTGRTAQRVRELWQRRLLDGYEVDPAQALGAGFDDPREDMVIVSSIAVHGVCPHHLLPFRGVAHVAYLPGGALARLRTHRAHDRRDQPSLYVSGVDHAPDRDGARDAWSGARRGVPDRGRAAVPVDGREPARRRACDHAVLRRRIRARRSGPQRVSSRHPPLGDAGGAPRPAFAGCGRGPADAARGSRLASFAGGGVRGVRAAARVRGRSTGSFGRSAERAQRAARIVREVRRAVRAL